jgi:hypothetical protein
MEEEAGLMFRSLQASKEKEAAEEAEIAGKLAIETA